MRGVITGREVVRHGWTIAREFGPAAYARCVVAVATRRPTTFLAVVSSRRRRPQALAGAVVGVALAITGVWAGRLEAGPSLTAPACVTACASEREPP